MQERPRCQTWVLDCPRLFTVRLESAVMGARGSSDWPYLANTVPRLADPPSLPGLNGSYASISKALTAILLPLPQTEFRIIPMPPQGFPL